MRLKCFRKGHNLTEWQITEDDTTVAVQRCKNIGCYHKASEPLRNFSEYRQKILIKEFLHTDG